MHRFLLDIYNNRHTRVFNFFNRCKCLAYLCTFTLAIFSVNLLTTYVKNERICFSLTQKKICYDILSPFALISMPYRHNLNKEKKQEKKTKKYLKKNHNHYCI